MTVTPAADLEVTISPAAGPAAVQAEWTYTLTVTNLGLVKRHERDRDGPTARRRSVSSGRHRRRVRIPMVLERHADGRSGRDRRRRNTATISVGVMPDAVETLSLAATVAGDQFDPNPANNSATFTEPVAPSVNLAVALAPSAQTVVTGQPLIDDGEHREHRAQSSDVGRSVPPHGVEPSLRFGQRELRALPAWSEVSLSPSSASSIPVPAPRSAWLSRRKHRERSRKPRACSSQQNQLNPANATATTTVTVLESPGTLQFGSLDVFGRQHGRRCRLFGRPHRSARSEPSR